MAAISRWSWLRLASYLLLLLVLVFAGVYPVQNVIGSAIKGVQVFCTVLWRTHLPQHIVRGAFRLVVLLLKLLYHAARISYKAPSLLNAVGWKLGLWQHVATMCLVVLVAQLKCCKHQCKQVVKEKGKVTFIPHTGKKRWGHKRRDPKWYYSHYTQPEYPLHPGTSAQLYQSLCYNFWNGYLWFAYVSP